MTRMDKVNEQIRREIGLILHEELSDPRLMLVSITRVIVSKDLRSARVYFSVFGDAAKIDQAQKALTSARGLLRKLVGQRIKMRFTPEFSFYYDDSIEFTNRIEETLKEIRNEAEEDHTGPEEA